VSLVDGGEGGAFGRFCTEAKEKGEAEREETEHGHG
jgi:hypothetical protein